MQQIRKARPNIFDLLLALEVPVGILLNTPPRGMGTGKRGGVLVVLGEEREDIRMEKAKNAENEHLVFKTSEVNLEIHSG